MKPYYQQDGITIYHGDCRELPECFSADVLLTDPPYGVNLGKHAGAAENRPGYLRKGAYESYDDTPEAFANVIVPTVSRFIRQTKRAAVFGVAPNIWKLPPPDVVGGILIPAGCGRTKWGFQTLATILLYGTAPELERGAKPSAVLIPGVSDTDIGHPCPKPMKWLTWLVGITSIRGETILDPFCGSGTTLRAAKDLGRQAIGCEIDEAYCEIAANRLAQGVLLTA